MVLVLPMAKGGLSPILPISDQQSSWRAGQTVVPPLRLLIESQVCPRRIPAGVSLLIGESPTWMRPDAPIGTRPNPLKADSPQSLHRGPCTRRTPYQGLVIAPSPTIHSDEVGVGA